MLITLIALTILNVAALVIGFLWVLNSGGESAVRRKCRAKIIIQNNEYRR